MDKETSFLIESLQSIGHEADEAVDFLENQLRTRFDSHAPLEIVPYRRLGNQQKSTLTGTVLAYREPLIET